MTGVNIPDWWPRRPCAPMEFPDPVTVCDCLTTTPRLCEPRLPGEHDPACPNRPSD